ncbi:exonuclease [Zoogloea sp.]|uniref:exonuclease n=1 Tax=Zoogloea sp. TaxID=49181 RepID=UPI0035B3A979
MEIYVSTDIETDGPVPGRNAMLSIASAAFTADKRMVASFTANLLSPPECSPDPATLRWWRTQPEAWEACRREPEPPEAVMGRYVDWLKCLPGRPVFVAYPVAFDYPFVLWYLTRYANENPFGYAVIDIRSYAMGSLGRSFRACRRDALPQSWFDPLPHTHVALDDAIEQGHWFCNMLQARSEADKGRDDPQR